MGLVERILQQHEEVLERVSLIPSSGGAFELSLDGELLFSKKAAGRFPTLEEALQALASRLGRS